MVNPTGTDKQFHGERLRVARLFHGYTRRNLSDVVGISSTALGRMESGRAVPSAAERRALASSLRVSAAFFRSPMRSDLDEETIHFRSRSATVHERSTAIAHATLLGDLLDLLRAHLDLPMCSVPELAGWAADDAAAACRSSWGLSKHRPIDNILRLAERAGVVVAYGSPGVMSTVDVFSARLHSGGALMILNPDDPPSRSASNVARALGHLALHSDRGSGDLQTEHEADRFARALVMPRDGLTEAWEAGPGHLDLDWLVEMKAWWRVSIQALVSRAHELQLISTAEYQRALIELSRRGWRTQEPGEFQWPSAEYLMHGFSAMERHYSIGPTKLADTLGLTPLFLAKLTGLDGLDRDQDLSSNVVSLASARRLVL